MAANQAKKQENLSEEKAELTDRLEQVFLAGLGALAAAQEVGTKTFESLVSQGEDFRKKANDKTDELIDDVQEAVREVRENAQSKAEGLFDQVRESSQVSRISSVFDQRVAGALKRLTVPSRADLEKLNVKLDRLIELVEGKQKVTVKKASKKKSARKTS